MAVHDELWPTLASKWVSSPCIPCPENAKACSALKRFTFLELKVKADHLAFFPRDLRRATLHMGLANSSCVVGEKPGQRETLKLYFGGCSFTEV